MIKKRINLICKTCNKSFDVRPSSAHRKYCSRKCYQESMIGHPQRNTGRTHFTKGRKHSEKHKEYMRKIAKERGFGKWMKGKKLSEETKEKIRKNRPDISKENHPQWVGDEKIGSSGYIDVYKPKHPLATKKGLVRRSHLAMEKILGRYLKPEEIIHHKGVHFPLGSLENKQDDSPENLELFKNNSEHLKFHHPKGKQFRNRWVKR